MSPAGDDRMMDTGDGARICAQGFGDPSDPAILLLMGQMASMLWWPEGLCERLASERFFVIRFDNRDTGLSTSYEAGTPPYGADELVADALAVLDGFDVEAAHLVGVSAGGAMAQLVALRHPDRVTSLCLISTTRVDPNDLDLPSPTAEYMEHLGAGADVDLGDRDARIDFLTEDSRFLAGDRPYDEAAMQELIGADFDRSRNPASLGNHALMDQGEEDRSLAGVKSPTLVAHGTADPLFPYEHGEALAAAIPGAELLTLEGGGHGLHEADWDQAAEAIAANAARA